MVFAGRGGKHHGRRDTVPAEESNHLCRTGQPQLFVIPEAATVSQRRCIGMAGNQNFPLIGMGCQYGAHLTHELALVRIQRHAAGEQRLLE